MAKRDWISKEIGPREVGTIAWHGYWREYALVVAVGREGAPFAWGGWFVTEVTCDEHGNRLPGFDGRERTHCTAWSEHDRVVGHVSAVA